MRELQTLSVFVNTRLTAVGEEILRTIRDALLEYQSEILRSKEENERLKRLLGIAVQQRLLQPEPSTVQPGADDRPCEWTSGTELLPQVKEEPQVRDLDEGNFGQAESTHISHSVPAESVSPFPATSQDIKYNIDRQGDRKPQPDSGEVHSPAAHQTCRLTRSDSCAVSEKRHRTRKAEQQTKDSGRASGIQSAHVLQITNIRSLKSPRSCSSHPGQSIKRWHSCKECGKGFSFACQLEVHMRWHTKEKPYNCAVCHKSFTTVSMLKRHHRIHTGEKPFRCHVCGKCFNQTAHLNTHFRLHTRERASWRQVTQVTAPTVK